MCLPYLRVSSYLESAALSVAHITTFPRASLAVFCLRYGFATREGPAACRIRKAFESVRHGRQEVERRRYVIFLVVYMVV